MPIGAAAENKIMSIAFVPYFITGGNGDSGVENLGEL
jgi:hypothetical protein